MTPNSKGCAPEPLPEGDGYLQRSLELAVAAKSGDREALDELWRRYEARVYRIVRIRLGSRVRRIIVGLYDSADIVQNAYIVATDRIAALELYSHASIIQWLSAIAQNQVRDALDRSQAQRRAPDREVRIDAPGSEAFDLPAREPQPLETISNQELVEIYDRCIEQLASDHRDVILLREYSGGSWDFIARELGRTNAHAAEELYRRARRALLSLLRKHVEL